MDKANKAGLRVYTVQVRLLFMLKMKLRAQSLVSIFPQMLM